MATSQGNITPENQPFGIDLHSFDTKTSEAVEKAGKQKGFLPR